jgi:hypothetical protein
MYRTSYLDLCNYPAIDLISIPDQFQLLAAFISQLAMSLRSIRTQVIRTRDLPNSSQSNAQALRKLRNSSFEVSEKNANKHEKRLEYLRRRSQKSRNVPLTRSSGCGPNLVCFAISWSASRVHFSPNAVLIFRIRKLIRDLFLTRASGCEHSKKRTPRNSDSDEVMYAVTDGLFPTDPSWEIKTERSMGWPWVN